MRVLIDTNVLISAAMSANGKPYKAFVKAVTFPNRGLVCEQNIDELRRVFNRKLPHMIPLLERFLALALPALELVPTPVDPAYEESTVRDTSDRPILRAALTANADVLLTGDKDFLEAGIERPVILTPDQFLAQ